MTSLAEVSSAPAEVIQQRWGLAEKVQNVGRKGIGLYDVDFQMGYLAVASHYAEAYGYTKHQPEIIEAIYNSTAHPMIGTVAVTAAVMAGATRLRPAERLAAFTAATTAGNFAIEQLQDFIVSPVHGFLASQHRFESAKDYFAALIGMGIGALMNRKNAV